MARNETGAGPWLAGLLFTIALAALFACSATTAWAATGGAPTAAGGPPPPPTRGGKANPNPVTGNLSLVSARTWPRKTFYFGLQHPRLSYEFDSDLPLNDLRVDVVASDGEVVKSYFRNGIAPRTPDSVRWDGTGLGGRPAKNGRYTFRIVPQAGDRAAQKAFQASVRRAKRRNLSSTATQQVSLGFALYGYAFPVLGPHDYGGHGAGFGAGRSGHTHQGHDVMAKCGAPLVAARGGRVRYSGFHAAAGNYLVIDGRGTGFDMAYMHLLQPSPLKAGAIVRTGQPIGLVGSTGSSTACHLHFEIWTAPGWYEGGSPIDPLPYLKRWDRYS